MKTFYSYDTPDNRLMIKLQTSLVIVSGIGIALSLVTMIFSLMGARQNMLTILLILGVCVITLIASLPARTRYMNRVKNETLVAHDWGVEHINGDYKREARWNEILKIDTYDRSFIFFKQKEYVISIVASDPIKFYSSLENADFMVNYVNKNLKKQAENVDLKWKN